MQRLLAIAGLTWKAAFRFRLFLVLAALLLASVVGLPLLIEDDGTPRGFTQILLTYTLSTITGLLGFATLWLSCGTLARDIEECQMQVLATKPVARWQIWLGKWIGIMSLNAALLALAGASVYGLLQWRAAHLPAAEQSVLRSQVLIARGAAGQADQSAAIDAETDRELADRLKASPDQQANLAEVRKEIRTQVQAGLEIVPPNSVRQWQIDLGHPRSYFGNLPMQLRVKFNTSGASSSSTFDGLWQFGEAGSTNFWPQEQPLALNMSPDTFHEIDIPANLCDASGRLTILFMNPNATTLSFPVADGIQVLYPEGGFALNYARGLGIIWCWLALLTALGLTAASFLSFPVAAFFSVGILIVGLSSGTISDAVDNGTVAAGNDETGVAGYSGADIVLIPVFKAVLVVINLAEDYSPIDDLSTGRAIPWSELGAAFAQIVLLLGGVIGLAGILLFNRRELATAQGTQ
jgi:ABC-type transport system involved in multi-copper enzyme maturation permease subunit